MGDRAVLFHAEAGDSLIINPAATFLWRQLDAAPKLVELAHLLLQRYPQADAATLRVDVEALFKALLAHDIVGLTTANS